MFDQMMKGEVSELQVWNHLLGTYAMIDNANIRNALVNYTFYLLSDSLWMKFVNYFERFPLYKHITLYYLFFNRNKKKVKSCIV